MTHNVWYARRATKDSDLLVCTRCGAEEESLLQYLIPEARGGCPDQAAFWLGGILPGSMLPPKPAPVLRARCNPVTVGDFARILKATGRCGVDASGGKLFSSNPCLRTVGAGVGAQALGESENDPWVAEEAYLASRAPGKQIVPRAEAWAIYLVLQLWDGTYDLDIVTDAS